QAAVLLDVGGEEGGVRQVLGYRQVRGKVAGHFLQTGAVAELDLPLQGHDLGLGGDVLEGLGGLHSSGEGGCFTVGEADAEVGGAGGQTGAGGKVGAGFEIGKLAGQLGGLLEGSAHTGRHRGGQAKELAGAQVRGDGGGHFG